MKYRQLPANKSDSNRILWGEGRGEGRIRNLRSIMRGGESSAVTNRHRKVQWSKRGADRVRKTSQRGVGSTRFKANSKQQWLGVLAFAGRCNRIRVCIKRNPRFHRFLAFCHCRHISWRESAKPIEKRFSWQLLANSRLGDFERN